MNTTTVTYQFPDETTVPEPASTAPAGWSVMPISRDTRYVWAEGRTKRSTPTRAFLNGMAALMEFPGLFPKRK